MRSMPTTSPASRYVRQEGLRFRVWGLQEGLRFRVWGLLRQVKSLGLGIRAELLHGSSDVPLLACCTLACLPSVLSLNPKP